MYSLVDWKKEIGKLKKSPDVKRAIADLLDEEWDQYIRRLQAKVILLLNHVLFAYSIHCVSKCIACNCRNVYL